MRPLPATGIVLLLLGLTALGWRVAAPGGAGSPGLVDDRAGLLSAAERRRLATYHAWLREHHGIDYRVVVDRGLDDLDRFAVEYVERHGVGGENGRGLLLVLDPAANQVRLEVGYGLEGRFSDAFVAYLQARQMTEFFAVDRVADGIQASTELIIAQAGGDAVPAIAGSGGAGARLPARMGEGRAAPGDERVAVEEGAPPREVLATYRQAMAARNDNPELEIYSRATRDMLADWVMTPAQMDNVAKSLAACSVVDERRSREGRRAVLLAAPNARRCPPYFLVRQDGAWRLDLAAMHRAVRFGPGNRWRLAPEALDAYAFAFEEVVRGP
ncbi:TPM domain-containing protein [Halomonas koreensis]|uniref:TPM domain-containing protein n=1 Tax=Halomonas koreensis TaxID=245385 RepID=A0ABU1G4J7_9GAMM|nr:TPM domain-containing protein [Halomonas koreensis]MDR5867883.1 TPM domain-containing protein [Halomonas koreensis]